MSNDQLIGRDIFQFVPLPYNLPDQLYRIWFDQYLAFQESEFPAMISIQGEPGTVGEEKMIANQKLLKQLGLENIEFNLNQFLLSIIRDTNIDLNEDISPKPKINRIRDDGPLKATLDIETPNGIYTLKLNICALLFNGVKVGQFVEVLEIKNVEDKQLDLTNRISQELLKELTHQSKSVVYYISLDESNLDSLHEAQMYMDPRLQNSDDVLIQNLRDFIGSLVIPEDLEGTVEGIKKAIRDFLETDQTSTTESVHPIRFRNQKGEFRDLIHRIFIRKEGSSIILTGYGLDLTDQFSQGNFHASLLDIIQELTSLSNYGQQLDLFVGRIKNVIPTVGTISVARPKGEGDFTFDARHKFEDSEIVNTSDIDNNMLEASLKILRRVYHSQGPVLISDYSNDEDTAILVERYNARSYVGVPITISEKVVGVISLSSHLSNAFSFDDINRLQVLSRFLAIAIDREMTLEVLQVEIANAVRESGILLREQEETIARIRSISTGLAHDSKTPLTVVNTSMYLIKKRLQQEGVSDEVIEKVEPYFAKIGEQMTRFNEMLNESVELLRSSADFADKMENVEIQSLVLKVIENCNDLPRPKQAEVLITPYFDKIPKDFKLFTGKDGLMRVLENLIGNAVKYSNENAKGIVNVKLKIIGQNLEIIIEDNGIGIPEEFESNIFREFKRADNALARQGTGVGLSFVKKFIEHLGGNVSFRKSGLENGTAFVINLPLNKDEGRGVGFLLEAAEKEA